MFSRAEQDAIRELLAEREGLRQRVADLEARIHSMEMSHSPTVQDGYLDIAHEHLIAMIAPRPGSKERRNGRGT